MAQVFLSLGSNLGDPYENIVKALSLLDQESGIRIEKVSSFHKTKPVDGPQQPDYLNAAVQISTDLTPERLLQVINQIEKKLGRIRTIKNGPRTIDLDILLFSDFKIDKPNLQIPHPRMYEREFVLKPLSEIAPDLAKSGLK
jgi:2-amino-4-hydroxy-6-hydroxymethyldihydropteridine diphosphokinase